MSPLTPPPDDESSEPSHDSHFLSPQETSEDPLLAAEFDITNSYTDDRLELTSSVGDEDMEMITSVKVTSSSISATGSIVTSTSTSLPFTSIIPSHISNPIPKGRLPPNPALYGQVQVAVLTRSKPNTPSPLSLYSFTLNTPPTSPALSATDLDVIDDIAPLGPSAAAFAANVDNEFGTQAREPQQISLQQVPQYDHQAQQCVTYAAHGYTQDQQQGQTAMQASVYGQSPSLSQQEYSQPQVVSSADPSMLGLMMDMQIHIHLQAQMQMSMAATAENGTMDNLQFAVEPIHLMMGDSATRMMTESDSHLATTTGMQDLHLNQRHPHDEQQPSQQGMPTTVHIQGMQYAYSGYFPPTQVVPPAQNQYDTFDQSPQQPVEYEHQQSFTSQESQSYQHHQDHAEQPFQSQYHSEYQHQEQHQPQSSTTFQGQSYEERHGGQRFDVRQQSSMIYDASALHQPTSTPVTSSSPYTLEMHNAALYFQQTLARFHEMQLIFKNEADEMHAHELQEFQKEREEKKIKLRKTKLVSRLPSCSMAVFSAHRAKGLWIVACKARMWEM